MNIKAILRNLFTGRNNQDLSFVRIFGAFGFIMIIFMVVIGVPLWSLIALHLGVTNLPKLEEWSQYFTGASVLVASTYAGLAGLLWAQEKRHDPTEENM